MQILHPTFDLCPSRRAKMLLYSSDDRGSEWPPRTGLPLATNPSFILCVLAAEGGAAVGADDRRTIVYLIDFLQNTFFKI